METLDAIVGKINAFAWGPPMLILLVGRGFWLTINLRGLLMGLHYQGFARFSGYFTMQEVS